MLTIYNQTAGDIQATVITEENNALVEQALWIDLISPTDAEEAFIEKLLAIEIPTKKEMEKIELSGRLYSEHDHLFMTTSMLAQSDSPEPVIDPVIFILAKDKLITIRYIEPLAFKLCISLLLRHKRKDYTPEKILLNLLESSTDRLSEILEKVSHQFDEISFTIFRQKNQDSMVQGVNYFQILQRIGINGDLGTKVRESLLSFIRALSFLEENVENKFSGKELSSLKIISRDMQELSNYASFIATKVNFLLDATLGMVNIQQNNIIKIFSVAAVIFLPPTLIASIYGMNFQHMPELHWLIGYPLALVAMLVSAILPYKFFKRRKWL